MKKNTVTFHEQEYTIHEDTFFEGPEGTKTLQPLDIEIPDDYVPTPMPNREKPSLTPIDEMVHDAPSASDVPEPTADSDETHRMLPDTPVLDLKHVEEQKAAAAVEKPTQRLVTPREDLSQRSADGAHKEMLMLEKENARLKQDNKKLSMTVQDLREDQVKNAQEIKSLRAVENRLQMEREKRTKIEERGIHRQLEKEQKLREAKERECDSLMERMKLEKSNAVNAISKWKDALEAERSRVIEGKKYIQSLQGLIEEEKRRSAAIANDLSNEKAELKSEITKLSQQSGASSSQLANERQECARLQTELEREHSERRNLEQALQLETRRLANRDTDVENLEGNMQVIRQERDRLAARLKSAEGEVSEKAAALAELQEKVNTFRDDNDEQRAQRRTAEDELSKFKLGYQSQYEKLCEYHSENASLRARNEDLQREASESRQIAQTQLESLQRQIEDYATQVGELQHDYDDRAAAHRRAQSEHEATRRILEDTQAQLHTKAAELTETQGLLDSERAARSAASNLQMETEAELNAKLQSITEEAQRQSRILQEVQDEAFANKHELHSLREKSASLKSELEGLRDTHATTLADLDMTRKRADEAESKVSFLEGELAAAREKAAEYLQSANDLNDRLRRREVDLTSMKDESRRAREELNSQIFDLRSKLNRLTIEHDSLKSEHSSDVHDRDEEIRSLKEERTRQALQIKNFTTDLHEARLENNKLSAAISSHTTHIEGLKAKVSAESDASERLRQQLLHQQEETERKEREIETFRYRMQEMEMRHENYQKDLIADLNSAREETNVAMTNANELKHRILNLEDELSEAQNGQSRTAERHFAEVEGLRADLSVAEVQRKALEDKLDSTQDDAVRSQSALHAAQTSLEDERRMRESLERRLGEAERAKRELEFAIDQKSAADVAKQQEEAQTQKFELRKVNMLQTQLSDMREQMEEQATAFDEIESKHRTAIHGLRDDLSKSERRNDTLQQELTVLIEQSKAIQPEPDAVPRAKYERLKSDFKTMRAQKEEISTELEGAKKSLELLETTPSTTKVAQEAIAFIRRERMAHLETRTQLNKCVAALRLVCKPWEVRPEPAAGTARSPSATPEKSIVPAAATTPRSVHKRPLEYTESPAKEAQTKLFTRSA